MADNEEFVGKLGDWTPPSETDLEEPDWFRKERERATAESEKRMAEEREAFEKKALREAEAATKRNEQAAEEPVEIFLPDPEPDETPVAFERTDEND